MKVNDKGKTDKVLAMLLLFIMLVLVALMLPRSVWGQTPKPMPRESLVVDTAIVSIAGDVDYWDGWLIIVAKIENHSAARQGVACQVELLDEEGNVLDAYTTFVGWVAPGEIREIWGEQQTWITAWAEEAWYVGILLHGVPRPRWRVALEY